MLFEQEKPLKNTIHEILKSTSIDEDSVETTINKTPDDFFQKENNHIAIRSQTKVLIAGGFVLLYLSIISIFGVFSSDKVNTNINTRVAFVNPTEITNKIVQNNVKPIIPKIQDNVIVLDEIVVTAPRIKEQDVNYKLKGDIVSKELDKLDANIQILKNNLDSLDKELKNQDFK